MAGHVENFTQLSRKAQLEAYDGCARLRPVWDNIASNYDAVITPSVVDEAPLGLESTGDAVSHHSFLTLWVQVLIRDLADRHSAPCGRFFKSLRSMYLAFSVRTACLLA